MKITYTNTLNYNDDKIFEVVERKGLGHPDTISDTIAENISIKYSEYCLEKYGCVLRHMVDKISVTGGSTKVWFGGGEILKPAKVIIKGRFTESVEGDTLPCLEICESAIYDVFKKAYHDFKKEHILIENQTHTSTGPGVVFTHQGESRNERKAFFTDQTSETLKYHNNGLRSNDTSTAVSYSPLSILEETVIRFEKFLNDTETKVKYPYIGTDIKVMGVRNHKDLEVTLCVPLISKYVKDIEDYRNKIDMIQSILENEKNKIPKEYNIKIRINTRDREKDDDLYLTLLGSALESGDEGAVGRGNRVQGIIPFTKNMTTEAACGKNPVYHIGKLYTAECYLISKEIYDRLGIKNTVFMTSQIGRDIRDPWAVTIITDNSLSDNDKGAIDELSNKIILNPEETTKRILQKEVPFF